MLRGIFLKAIRLSWLSIIIFAVSELFGGVYLALLISSFADQNFLNDYGITNEYLLIGFILFSAKSFLSYACLKKMLMTSFNISRDVVITHLNKVLNINSTEAIETDKLIKNVSHEVLSLQANGTTPILFISSDSLAIFLMFITAAYFAPFVVIIFLILSAIIGLISYLVTKALTNIALLRSESEQKKVEYTRSLSTSRLIYQNLNIKKIFNATIREFASTSAENGMKHQSITQLPRIYLELLLVIVFSGIVVSNTGISQNYLIASIIMLRTIPNLVRIIYNQANIKAAHVSAQLLEEGLIKGYVKKDVITELSCRLVKNQKLYINTNDERYEKIIEIPTGLSVIVGPSGSGKSVLFRAVIRELNDLNLDAKYFSRSMINDELAVEYLASNFLNKPKSELIEHEVYEIAQRVSLGKKASTGEAERLILAFASQIDAEVVVLDEYFINIEDSQKSLYMEMIKKKRKDRFTILISHDQFVQGNESTHKLEVIN